MKNYSKPRQVVQKYDIHIALESIEEIWAMKYLIKQMLKCSDGVIISKTSNQISGLRLLFRELDQDMSPGAEEN